MQTRRRLLLILLVILLVTAGASACGKASEEKAPESVVLVEAVTLNPHPASLEGKTVLLRWNGKYNGDNFLNRVAEVLAEQVKDVEVIKMWEVDSDTACISESSEVSEEIAAKIAELEPDLVIASQAD